MDVNDLASVLRVEAVVKQFDEIQREALLANPLIDFDKLLLIRRVPDGDPRRPHGTGYGVGEYIGLPRQSSKCNPNIDRPFDWDNEIAVLSGITRDGQLTTLFQSRGTEADDRHRSALGRRQVTVFDARRTRQMARI